MRMNIADPNGKAINPFNFFGKDATSLDEAMSLAFRSTLSSSTRYSGCLNKEMCDARDAEIDKAFKTIFGYAKTHNIFFDWGSKPGLNQGDKWTVYKHHKVIAYIQM